MLTDEVYALCRREHDAPACGQLVVLERLRERLQEAHFRPDDARRDVGVQRLERPAPRVEDVVAAVADQRVRELRETHLREHAVDERGERIVWQERDIEDLGVLEGIAPRDAEEAARVAARFRAQLARADHETRALRLVDDARQQQVGARVE